MIATVAQERFYFWRGFYDALALLPTDEQRGRFVMAMCAFAFDDERADLSDDPTLAFAWALISDQVRESVEIGREASRRGSMGGRPKKGEKSSAKSRAKTSALSTALSTAKSSALTSAKSSAESCAESTAKSVRYSKVPSGCAPSLGAQALAAEEGGDAYAEPDGPPMTEEEVDEKLAALGLA